MTIVEHVRAVVTGAGSGLGRAIAVEIASRGGRVLVTDIDEPAGLETVRMLRDAGAAAGESVLKPLQGYGWLERRVVLTDEWLSPKQFRVPSPL